ncbi:MAG: aminotransferase class V-fold PLP-dependent enzyme [Desulfobacterales bacterium]|nr:aminotransferase class V-fold PLP-dependent enzyme [Desulfobacterales bacterium]
MVKDGQKLPLQEARPVGTIEADWGKAIDPAVLKKRLDEDVNKEIKFVTFTHNETSTGATNDVQALNDIIQAHGALSIVDGVSSIGAMPFKMDEWGVDVVVSGCQKGFMIPPGLAFLSCSQKAWKVYEQCQYPSFYFNWELIKRTPQMTLLLIPLMFR